MTGFAGRAHILFGCQHQLSAGRKTFIALQAANIHTFRQISAAKMNLAPYIIVAPHLLPGTIIYDKLGLCTKEIDSAFGT